MALSTFDAVFCDHMKIAPCCEPDCGHYSCPCGLYWDDGAWGGGPFDEDDPEFATLNGPYDFGPAST